MNTNEKLLQNSFKETDYLLRIMCLSETAFALNFLNCFTSITSFVEGFTL